MLPIYAATFWEVFWWAKRRRDRADAFAAADALATSLQRPLVIVGAPDRGVTSGYGCGDAARSDVVVDIQPSTCPNSMVADITKTLPFADDSVVVFVACVLEYVADVASAVSELMRISGGNCIFVTVEPWTLTAYMYPGARTILT